MPLLLFLAFDPVEDEGAQAQVAHEHDETDEPSSDHYNNCFRRRRGCSSDVSLRRSAVTIAARYRTGSGEGLFFFILAALAARDSYGRGEKTNYENRHRRKFKKTDNGGGDRKTENRRPDGRINAYRFRRRATLASADGRTARCSGDVGRRSCSAAASGSCDRGARPTPDKNFYRSPLSVGYEVT